MFIIAPYDSNTPNNPSNSDNSFVSVGTEAERLAIGDAVAQAATSLGFFYVEGSKHLTC